MFGYGDMVEASWLTMGTDSRILDRPPPILVNMPFVLSNLKVLTSSCLCSRFRANYIHGEFAESVSFAIHLNSIILSAFTL